MSAEYPPFTRISAPTDRKSTRLNSSHVSISYAVFCLKKKKRARIVLRAAEALSKHADNIGADIETDKIGQRKRSQRMRHAEYKQLRHVFWRHHAIHN